MYPPRQAEMTGSRLAVLLAVVGEHRDHGRATVRSVAARAGLSSTSTVASHLDRLRRDGWVDWKDARAGTLHPLVRPVPFGVVAPSDVP
jgi:SOS-response transcriptional repressor LexA